MAKNFEDGKKYKKRRIMEDQDLKMFSRNKKYRNNLDKEPLDDYGLEEEYFLKRISR